MIGNRVMEVEQTRLPDRMVLHPDVASLWSMRQIPDSKDAMYLLETNLPLGWVQLTVSEGIRLDVLEVVSRENAKDTRWPMDQFVSDGLLDEIDTVLNYLIKQEWIEVKPINNLIRKAFRLACWYSVGFHDAIAVVLAIILNRPLLVADEDRYYELLPIEDDYQEFRLILLRNYPLGPRLDP